MVRRWTEERKACKKRKKERRHILRTGDFWSYFFISLSIVRESWHSSHSSSLLGNSGQICYCIYSGVGRDHMGEEYRTFDYGSYSFNGGLDLFLVVGVILGRMRFQLLHAFLGILTFTDERYGVFLLSTC